ncbi:methyltransferase, partial [Streptomyces sp. NPDC001773]
FWSLSPAAAPASPLLSVLPFSSWLQKPESAFTMFHGARTALRQGGELWVVGNRHLGYHTQLRRTFGNCTTVAGDPKFVVLRAVKR